MVVLRGQSAAHVAPRIFLYGRRKLGVFQRHRLGNAMHGEIARHLEFAAFTLRHRFGGEGHGRKFRGVEEISTLQMLIALCVIGVDGGGIQRHFGFRHFFAVGGESPFHAGHFAAHVRDHHVLDL